MRKTYGHRLVGKLCWVWNITYTKRKPAIIRKYDDKNHLYPVYYIGEKEWYMEAKPIMPKEVKQFIYKPDEKG